MCLRGSCYYSDGFSVFLLAFYNTKKTVITCDIYFFKKKWIIHYLCIHHTWMILQFYFDISIPHTCIRLGQTGLFSGTAGSPGSVWAPEHGSTGVDVSSGHQMGQRYRLEGGNIETEMLHKPRDANMLHCEKCNQIALWVTKSLVFLCLPCSSSRGSVTESLCYCASKQLPLDYKAFFRLRLPHCSVNILQSTLSPILVWWHTFSLWATATFSSPR